MDGRRWLKAHCYCYSGFWLPEPDWHPPPPLTDSRSPLQGGSECPVWCLFHRRNKDIANILAAVANLDTFLPLFLNDKFQWFCSLRYISLRMEMYYFTKILLNHLKQCLLRRKCCNGVCTVKESHMCTWLSHEWNGRPSYAKVLPHLPAGSDITIFFFCFYLEGLILRYI